jgi:hypothetical protein
VNKPSTIDILNAVQNGMTLPPATPAYKGVPRPSFGEMRENAPGADIYTPKGWVYSGDLDLLRSDLISKLSVGIWTIEFEKIDGTVSIMEATLDPRLLPSPSTTKAGPRDTSEAQHLLYVYAVDRQGWRCFVINNVIRMYQPSENL